MEKVDMINLVNQLDEKDTKTLHSLVVERVKNFRSIKAAENKMSLYVGASVTCTSGRLKGRTGKVTKINKKNAVCEFDGQGWNIPMSMLELNE